jgi:hypothetical protein
MKITIKNHAVFSVLAMTLITISSCGAQNADEKIMNKSQEKTDTKTSTRNYNDASGFVFGDIKFNMAYTSARSFLLNAPDNYSEKDRTFLSIGKFGSKFLDMPISDTVEMGFYNKKLNRLVFIMNPSDLNTDNITKEFNKKPETLSDAWAYWVNGNYVLDITTDSMSNKKRLQLEYMGF